MDLSKTESATDHSDGSSSNSQLLRDIEAISKALYLPTPPLKASISLYHTRSKSAERTRSSEVKSSQNSAILNETVLQKNKKSSLLWNWKKPLKTLAHIRQHRFNICFFLHVHSIEGLPTNFNDVTLRVHWKRKDEVIGTCPSTVLRGTAEFEETLMHKCSVYGSRSGAHNSAKYEVKLSLIFASVVGAPEADIGKHWLDLTRLLPLTLEELEGEKSSGKWTTSFKLAGRAKGGTLNVSFGFSVMKDNLAEAKNNMNDSKLINLTQSRPTTTLESVKGFEMTSENKMLRRVGSVPRKLDHTSVLSSTSLDVKVYQEVSPILSMELSKSINFLCEKLNEGNLHVSKEFDLLSEHVKQPNNLSFASANDISESECDYVDFTVVEKGIEMSKKEQLEPKESVRTINDSTVETINVDEIIKDDDITLEEEIEFKPKANTCRTCLDEVLIDNSKHEYITECATGSNMGELELALGGIFISELTDLESSLAMDEFFDQESYMETKSHYKASKISNTSLSLDDVMESVATDFLNTLEIGQAPSGLSFDGNPESPRESLLREFEKETLASGNFILGFDASERQVEFSCHASTGSGCRDAYKDFEPVIQGLEEKHKREGQLLKNRRKTNILEDLETEYLMQEWGFTESAFQNSPHYCSDGFGSPVELPPEDPLELPPLGDGFGPFVETKGGGYLRSMNPSIFRNARSIGNLVMQISKPVVLPPEMGSEIIDILQHLAAIGIEKFSMQVNKLMPLEDITGKTLVEVAQESALPNRQTSLQHNLLFAQDSYPGKQEDEELQSGHTYDSMCSGLVSSQMGSGCVSVSDFACSVMDRIEALSIEGLRIQCGMADEDAPSCIRTHSVGKNTTFESKIGNFVGSLSSEGAAGLHLLDGRDEANDVDELMELSITLNQWLKLDSGIIADEDQVSEHTLKILAAHHANCVDLVSGTLTSYINFNEGSGKMHGLLGSNLNLAVMVLLRDPLRNYEPVGTSMLALFQVERVFVPVKPKIYRTTSVGNEGTDNEANTEEEFGDKRNEGKEVEEEESSPCFKFSEVHLAGLNTELGKNQLWGNKSGTRWLLSSGMEKSNKRPLSKSKAIVISHHHGKRKLRNEDVLWSITCNIHDPGHWRGFAASVPYIRNPDVLFPNESTQSHLSCNV